MSIDNVEQVGTSLVDVQSRKRQILEEENDTNVEQNFSTSICSVCNKAATVKCIYCSECHIQIYYRCVFLPSHQLHYFADKKSKYTYNTHVLIVREQGLVD